MIGACALALRSLVSSEEIADPFAVSFQRKPMYIKKLTNSNLLKRGELLIVLNCLGRYDDALIDLRKSAQTGVVRFYRHREEPVPWVGRWKNGRCFRHPRTTNERRANCAVNTLTQVLENHGLAFKVRPKRSSHRLPTVYDEIFLRHQRSWKEYRRTQRKVAGAINRRIHSPPFWARESTIAAKRRRAC
jgi:hypothetical protein